MADFNFYLNRQGVRGVQGVKGDDGFSPIITVAQDNADGYKLHIQTATDDFDTSNLRPPITNAGGKYLLWDNSTGTMTAGFLDYASADVVGGVNLATAADMTEGENTQVVPSVKVVADYIASELEGNNTTISNTITQAIYGNIDATSDDTNIIVTKNLDPATTNITGVSIGLNSTLTNIGSIKGQESTNNILLDKLNLILFNSVNPAIIKEISIWGIDSKADLINNSLTDGSETFSVTGDGYYRMGAPAVWVKYPNITGTHFLLDEGALINGGGLTITNNNASVKYTLHSDTQDGVKRPTMTISVNADNDTIKINEQGQLYADIQVEEVPVATTSAAGIVKPDGSTITVDADGTISVVGGGSGGGDVTAAGNNTFTGNNEFTGSTYFSGSFEHDGSLANFNDGLCVGISSYAIYRNSTTLVIDSFNDIKVSGKAGDISITYNGDQSGIYIDPDLGMNSGTSNVYIGNNQKGTLKIGENSVTFSKTDGTNIDLLNPTVDLSEINSQISAMQADIAAIEQQIGNIVTRLNEINGEDI